MTLQLTQSQLQWPSRLPTYNLWSSGSATIGQDMVTANDQIHMIGRIRWEGDVTKTLSKIHLSFLGSVSGGTVLTVGLQSLSATVDPLRGDGTFTHSGTVVTPTAGTVTTTLGSGPSLASGDLVCATAKVSTSNATWQIRGYVTGAVGSLPGVVLNTTARSLVPCILFESTDGVYGTFEGSSFVSVNDSTLTLNQVSTPSERGVVFRVPFACTMRSAWFRGYYNNDSTGYGSIALYSDVLNPTPASIVTMETRTVPRAEIVMQNNSVRNNTVRFANTHTLSPGVDYGFTLTGLGPGVGPNFGHIYVAESDIGTAAFRAGLPGGLYYYGISRNTTSDAFTAHTSKFILAGIYIEKLNDSSGSGGGSTFGRSIPLVTK